MRSKHPVYSERRKTVCVGKFLAGDEGRGEAFWVSAGVDKMFIEPAGAQARKMLSYFWKAAKTERPGAGEDAKMPESRAPALKARERGSLPERRRERNLCIEIGGKYEGNRIFS